MSVRMKDNFMKYHTEKKRKSLGKLCFSNLKLRYKILISDKEDQFLKLRVTLKAAALMIFDKIIYT